MGGSFQIGRIAGISVKVHITFALTVLYFAFSGFGRSPTLAGALAGLESMVVLFACILLHELGHSLAAQRYGIRTVDITLWPLGGLARLARMPATPVQELVIAAAGPVVNVAIVVVGFALMWLTGRSLVPNALLPAALLASSPAWRLLSYLLLINGVLLVFNLIPAFPMDGGRMFRAGLSLLIGWSRATRVATLLGQGIAVIFVVIGIFGIPGGPGTANLSLLLVGIFVFLGANQETQTAAQSGPLGRLTVADAMTRQYAELHPLQLITVAVKLADETGQPAFPVLEDGVLQGIVVTSDLDDAYYSVGRTMPVTAVMRRFYPIVRPNDPLDGVQSRLREAHVEASVVMNDGHVVGLVSQKAIEDVAAQVERVKHTKRL